MQSPNKSGSSASSSITLGAAGNGTTDLFLPGQPTNLSGTEYLVIDGQGRVTTGTATLAPNYTIAVQNAFNCTHQGQDSICFGHNSSATGDYTSAIGANSTASGYEATAVGAEAAATNGSVAVGAFANANATNGIAIGVASNATGLSSIAVGENSSAAGNRSRHGLPSQRQCQ